MNKCGSLLSSCIRPSFLHHIACRPTGSSLPIFSFQPRTIHNNQTRSSSAIPQTKRIKASQRYTIPNHATNWAQRTTSDLLFRLLDKAFERLEIITWVIRHLHKEFDAIKRSGGFHRDYKGDVELIEKEKRIEE